MNLKQKMIRYVARDRKVVSNGCRSFTNIFDCADSHYSKGSLCYECTPSNKNSHQFRLNNQSLQKFAVQVEKELQDWSGINSFEGLFAKIKTIVENIKEGSDNRDKLGELIVYDCAVRIAYLKYMNHEGDYRPKEQVYIHAGVYKGAMWLFENRYIVKRPKCNTMMPVEVFCEKQFQSLFAALSLDEFEGFTKSMILESFMCMMMDNEPPRLCRKCRLEH